MRASDRRKGSEPSEVIEFVPRKELDQAEREIERLQKENERLQRQSERLQRERERLKQETERLRRELEAALRASKRQAAPHSRGKPKSNPKQPGRKPGRKYGKQACRPVPSRVDEQISVPLPKCCPHCGGSDVQPESCQAQYQEDIVRKTVVRRFDIAVGRCRGCARQVQGRHPLQTSGAVGVGAIQPGPEGLTLAAILNKQMGLSLGHTQQVLSYGFGLEASRAGLYRALARMARRTEPTYAGLVATARQSPVNGVDETGWKVGGRLQWMHVAVSAQVTVYAILPGRGYEQSVTILGADYDGFLVHDGWAPYYRFRSAFHQRHEQGEITEHGLCSATGRVVAKLDRMLDTIDQNPANQRLARHLDHERPWIFTFLYCPGLDATNNAAERAIRGMVIARKVWGGNRTWEGARTQQVLVSVLRTCWQQGKDAFAQMVWLLRAPRAVTLDIVPGSGCTALNPPSIAIPCLTP